MSIHDFKLNLSSSDGINQDLTGTTNLSYLKFNYDFAKHKRGFYSVKFTYLGDYLNTFTPSPVYGMALSVQLPYVHNYRLKENDYLTSQILGYCYPQILNSGNETGILYADLNTNGETVVSLPLSNSITVNTLFTDALNYWKDGAGQENAGYNLTLYFKYLGDNQV